MNVVRLTALVSAHNQDSQLSACLRRLSFCDEVVVVADRCVDRSHEIARRQGARVVDGIFPLETQRKAAGLEACGEGWILELDADEQVDSALAWEIRAALQLRPTVEAFEIPIDNYVGEALVRGGWTGAVSTGRAVRLYRKGAKQWAPQRRCEGAPAPDVAVGALKGAIRRSLGADLGDVVGRLNRLSGLAAEDRAETGRAGLLAVALAAGAGAFLVSLLARGGWREGRLGAFAAVAAALFPVLVQMRARELVEARRDRADERAALPEVVGLGAR